MNARTPGDVRDLSDAQRALLVIAGLDWGLNVDQLDPLLAVTIPDATVRDRGLRYRRVRDVFARWEALGSGQLDSAAFLGLRDPDDDSDEDDRLHAATILAWFEVTDALHAAARAVTVDDHAADIIGILAAPEQDGWVAA